jgi:type VI secretion system protein ImpM
MNTESGSDDPGNKDFGNQDRGIKPAGGQDRGNEGPGSGGTGPSAGETAPAAGFFGKLPSRGDFVRAGLPADFVSAWDLWCQRMMTESRTALREDWEAAWLEAPVWRFALPRGDCGTGAALGVWIASVDAVGRYFPLTIAVVAPCSLSELAARAGLFLDRAEQAGREALGQGLDPSELARRAADALHTQPAPTEPAPRDPGWWTEGSPGVAPAAYTFPGLPDAGFFVRMLIDAERGP